MNKFQQIDDLLRPDHTFIEPDDICLFYGTYTVTHQLDEHGKKIPPYKLGPINNLVYNFKKPVSKKGQKEYWYKEDAILKIARILYSEFKGIDGLTWVPVPPSKDSSHPDHDNRLELVLNEFQKLKPSIDIRKLVRQVDSRKAMHEGEEHRSPETLYAHYEMDTTLLYPTPDIVAVFDDVLCTGSSYKAVKRLLAENIKGVQVMGVFVARRIPEAEII